MQAVLKKALAYDGLARGLHEAARAIERDEAKVCSPPLRSHCKYRLRKIVHFWFVQAARATRIM